MEPQVVRSSGPFQTGGSKMLDNKRRPIILLVLPLIIGIGGFNRVTQSPNYELYRTVDVIQLLGSGACFGAALVGVITSIIRRRHS